MGRWVELKVRIEETALGTKQTVEVLDISEDLAEDYEDFLDMLWEDYGIEISDEEFEEILKKKKEVGGA